MGRTVKAQCHKPSGTELQSFGVKGIIESLPPEDKQIENLYGNADQTLHIPYFSASSTPAEDEVDLTQWVYHVKQAQQHCSSEVVRAWIYRSLRGAALLTVINLGEGIPTAQILYRLCLKYSSVSTFDDLMKAYLGIAQRPIELVTDYVVRLEHSYSRLCSEYPQRFDRNSQTQHLRKRFYQGLRREIQSRMTPSYNDNRVSSP